MANTAGQPGDLSTVATTGNYNDLSNKPTIPAAQVNSDWNASSGVAQILNKPTLGTMATESASDYTPTSGLATVATTGAYSDLSGTPTIPTVNNATLTIQKNSVGVATFTANASSNVTANITVPTKISDLTNDSNFANQDLSNLTSTGANIGNWSSNVSNCITEIPQDIKLTLSDGTLTLKSGSKLYVPNGSGTFDILTLTADKTATQSANDSRMYFYNGSYIEKFPISQCYSGTTAPSGQTYMFWYDTANNLMKMTTNGGSTWTSGWSLPFCLATASSGALTSIDQVFNGFGYIGSTIFSLPNIKGLIPNGRNADGTLKSVAFTTSSVKTQTLTTSTFNNRNIILKANSFGFSSSASYDEKTNTVSSGTEMIVGNGSASSGKITSLYTKQAFHAVDYSDGDYIASCAMPSNKYIDLTLGTDGSTYTAPADGYMVFHKGSNAAGQRIGLIVNNGARNIIYSSGANQYMAVTIPVQKGNVVTINYTAGVSETTAFRFVYANGSK